MRAVFAVLSSVFLVAACGQVQAPIADAPPADAPPIDAPLADAPIDGPTDAPTIDDVVLTITRSGPGTVTSTPAGIACGAACTLTVPRGTQVTLTAAADANAAFGGWGGACTGTAPTCVLTLAADATATATFAPARRTVAVAVTGPGSVTSTPAGIACPGQCTMQVDHGAAVTLTPTPQGTATFLGWAGGACTGTGACALTATADVAVNAAFSLDYTLVVTRSGTAAASGTVTSSPAGISCGATCSHTYGAGATITLTASAAADATFTGWSGGGCSGTGTCTVTLSTALAVDAAFTRRTYPLTVATAGAGSGVVTSNPAGITCGAGNLDCGETYDHGTAVTLTASPGATSTFAGWSGACTGAGACVVTMTQARSVSATFAPIITTLTISRGGAGSGTITSSPAGITCGADCSEPYAAGTGVTLTATPAAGSSFGGWSGGGCGAATTCTLTMGATALTVTATFDLAAYDTQITLGPPTSTQVTTATFQFTSVPAGATSFECAIDEERFVACASPATYADLAGTVHRFSVRALNGALADPTPATYAWTISGTQPRLPDSPTALCSSGAGPAGCPDGPAGQDGHYRIDVPFYQGGQSSVFDSVTGLVWERNLVAATTAAAALTYCQNLTLDGLTEWRLPSRLELLTIVDAGRVLAPFDPQAFPAIPQASFLRTRTPVAGATGTTWGINTNYAVLAPIADGDAHLVRCVHNTQGGGAIASYSAGTLFDGRTNLYWQQATLPAATWTGALAACEASTVDGLTDWRLPSLKELASIVDDTRSDPAISTAFTDRPATGFWSSSPQPNTPSEAYAISFASGASAGIGTPMTTSLRVRCVR